MQELRLTWKAARLFFFKIPKNRKDRLAWTIVASIYVGGFFGVIIALLIRTV